MKNVYLSFLKLFKISFNCIIILLPWQLRRIILIHCYHYKIAKTAHIGIAYIYPKHLRMDDKATIKNFNIAINLDTIILEKNSLIDRNNWITGFPIGTNSPFFQQEKNRISSLILQENSVITKKHHFDCTNTISIGKYTTIAGYNSQFLTHSVNIYTNKQESKPIHIGNYSFISTNVTVLGGSNIPNYSVVGAGAVLNKDYSTDAPFGLYTGIPALRKKEINKKALYFYRKQRDVI